MAWPLFSIISLDTIYDMQLYSIIVYYTALEQFVPKVVGCNSPGEPEEGY